MSQPDPDLVIRKIRAVIEVVACNPPATPALIDDVEHRIAVVFPEWLRTIYRSCNGFCGPTGVRYLYPLDGRYGVLEFNLFLRSQEWSPPWVKRSIIFGDNGVGGTITTHWAALDDKLIEWCYADRAEFTVLDSDLFELWRREQEDWNALTEE